MDQREQRYLLALGRAISEIRADRGADVAQLAIAAGVDRRRIAALEAGRLDPAYELLLALGDGLGVPVSAFVLRAEELLAEEASSGQTEC
jgi:transcriptional regulator with XRE-family HTH domain